MEEGQGTALEFWKRKAPQIAKAIGAHFVDLLVTVVDGDKDVSPA